MHQGSCYMVNIAHNRQYLQIALSSCKCIQWTLCKIIVEAILVFLFIEMEIPRIFFILRMLVQPLCISFHHFLNSFYTARLIGIDHFPMRSHILYAYYYLYIYILLPYTFCIHKRNARSQLF